MRVFVAVDLSDEAREAVGEYMAALARHPAFSDLSLRWVNLGKLHITLQFLGDVAGEEVPRITLAVNRKLHQRTFRVALEEAGVFPIRGAPRVVWLGARCGSEEMGELHAEVGVHLEAAGHMCDARPFKPHVTIARVKRARGSDTLRIRAAFDRRPLRIPVWYVDHVTLYESRLSPHGAAYHHLTSTPLAPE